MKRYKTYLEFLNEANAKSIKAGKLEFSKISYKDAINHCETIDLDILGRIPDFKVRFEYIKKRISEGSTKRKDMPRITRNDIKLFADKLRNGELDVNKPYAPGTKEVFPEKMDSKERKHFLIKGLLDGDERDDIINVFDEKIEIAKLHPTQEQIYFDQVTTFFLDFETVEQALLKNANKKIICSKDNDIIDGHHYFAYLYIVDPTIKINILRVDLDTEKLLKLGKSFGEAVGNERNK